jgi:diguanylate cyclase (GGDEF)-like protein
MNIKYRFLGILFIGLVWTGCLLIFHGLTLDPSGAIWRLRAVFILAWVLGLIILWLWPRVPGAVWTGRAETGMAEETIDSITGFPNRSSFRRIVQEYLDASGEMDDKSLILLICVKDLDKIAESYGDEEAERIMVRVSRALLDSLRGADLLGRHDKDELAAFLPKAADDSWETISERIHMNVAAQYRQIDKPYDIIVSTGHSEFDPASPVSLVLLLRQAYEEMIKNLGNNQT